MCLRLRLLSKVKVGTLQLAVPKVLTSVMPREGGGDEPMNPLVSLYIFAQCPPPVSPWHRHGGSCMMSPWAQPVCDPTPLVPEPNTRVLNPHKSRRFETTLDIKKNGETTLDINGGKKTR